jgi:hypothetical protein
VSTHLDVQRVGVGAVQLDEQAGSPAVVEQIPVGATHLFVQLPQVEGAVRSVSQPSSARIEQCANPEVQTVGGI